MQSAPTAGTGLDTNDVSNLFPAPAKAAETARLVTLKGLAADGSSPHLSRKAFDAILDFAQNETKADITLFTVPSAKNYDA